jgi:hypothetical protein
MSNTIEKVFFFSKKRKKRRRKMRLSKTQNSLNSKEGVPKRVKIKGRRKRPEKKGRNKKENKGS